MTSTYSGEHAVDEGRHLRLRRLLLAWHRTEGRPLAWRQTHDPYRILVSEVMLQQTQAARVEPIFKEFLDRFPDVRSLAAAPLADVLRAWQGLGYNRRAISLHRAARTIAAHHDGQVPDDLAALRALPGVGAYTARAVLAFAFNQDSAPVDVNVARVLARAVAGSPQSRAEVQRLADELVPHGEAEGWSAALMDLGASYCTARSPRCAACPVAAACVWRGAGGGRPDSPPDPAASTAMRSVPADRFSGSDRYHRGRLVDSLRRGPVEADALPVAADLDDTGRLVALTRTLIEDGLVEWHDGTLRLPD